MSGTRLLHALRRSLVGRITSGAVVGHAVFMLTAGAVGLEAPSARAAMLGTGPDAFAVFSGGQLSAGTGVVVEGSVGAQSMWLGNNTSISGSAYSGAALDTGQGVAIGADLYALGNVYLGNNTTVGGDAAAGGNLGMGTKAAIIGNAVTAARLSMGNKSTVGGDAWYGSDYWVAKNADITGSLSLLDAPVQNWSPDDLPSITGPDPGAGTQWYAARSQANLDPGSFGSLSTSSAVDVSLVAGTYSFQSIWLDHHSTLTVDTQAGDAVIHVSQSFSTGQYVNINVVGDGSLTVYVGGSVWLDHHNEVQANFVSLGSTIGLGTDTSVQGVLWAAGDVSLGNQSQVVAPTGMATITTSGTSAAIPEPATMALTLLGIAVITRRRPAAHR